MFQNIFLTNLDELYWIVYAYLCEKSWEFRHYEKTKGIMLPVGQM